MPAGYVVVVHTAEDLDDWTPSVVQMTGLDGVNFPSDPEPEFVSINENNVAVVTLQENNAIVLIDLATKTVSNSFSAGSVNLTMIDTEEEPEALIDQSSSLDNVPREPDGVTFLGNGDYFATADEGDFLGGSRGFTVYSTGDGSIVYSSGSFMDRMAASLGHYNDGRSENKGVEPENVSFGTFEGDDYLFVNAERAGLVFVYEVSDPSAPIFKQVLPTNIAPEGSFTIPERNLVVVASEADSREDKFRSTIVIYHYSCDAAQYPTVMSKMSKNGKKAPIPFAALSGLSNDPSNPKILYTIEDSFYKSSRFFTIDTSHSPAILTTETHIVDDNDVFASLPPSGEFSSENLAAMINPDKTVNIDPEGIAADGHGVLYIASEGRGTVGDESRPVESLNMIFEVDGENGSILRIITLPEDLNDIQVRFGLEGIAYVPPKESRNGSGKGAFLVACLQRAWGASDKGPLIMVYSIKKDEWVGRAVYPLDEPESQNGGWVGLSDISWVEDMRFYVLERDNMGQLDAAVKRIYSIDLDGFDEPGYSVEKYLVNDLIKDDVYGSTGGLNVEKIEGMARNGKGWWIVNDNDGVDDNSGEIQLLNLGRL